MTITINTGDVDAARARAAEAELRRMLDPAESAPELPTLPKLTMPPLPYDKGASVADEPPHCRFCLQAGEQVKGGGDAWRCSMEGCVGRREWVRREVFEAGVESGNRESGKGPEQ